jgi:Gpi18-like mannosyltransferase
MKRIPLLDIAGLFLATRALFVTITYIAYILLTAPKYSDTPVNVYNLLNSWNHLDTRHYLTIAQFGYTKSIYDFAFFPLFPYMIRYPAYLLGNWSFLLIGTLISNLAFFGVLCLAYLLASEITEERAAKRTLIYLSIFPTAFFFFAAYNESLYLFFTLGAFLALRRQRWWLAGLLGMLSVLTRSLGLLLVIPFAYELWQQRETVFANVRHALLAMLPILLVPLGLVLYALYCWYRTGNPFMFLVAQSDWSRQLSWPWTGLFQGVVALALQNFGSANEAHILLDLGATIGFIVLIVLGWRKLPRGYTYWMIVFMLCVLLEPAMSKPDILLSNQRFVLEMVPAFITLALLGLKHPRLHHTLMVLFPILLAVLSIAFIMNRWIV